MRGRGLRSWGPFCSCRTSRVPETAKVQPPNTFYVCDAGFSCDRTYGGGRCYPKWKGVGGRNEPCYNGTMCDGSLQCDSNNFCVYQSTTASASAPTSTSALSDTNNTLVCGGRALGSFEALGALVPIYACAEKAEATFDPICNLDKLPNRTLTDNEKGSSVSAATPASLASHQTTASCRNRAKLSISIRAANSVCNANFAAAPALRRRLRLPSSRSSLDFFCTFFKA